MGILANNEGKILRSNQTGSVLKQNYNFGRAFNPTLSYEGIEIDLNMTGDFSFVFFYKDDSTTRETVASIDDADINACYFSSSPASAGNFITKGLFAGNTILKGKSNVFLISTILENTTIGVFSVGGKQYLNVAPLESKVTDIYISNTILLDNEINFLFNNSLGNEIINNSGLIVHLKTKEAIAKDLGSGLVPVIENEISDNYHGKILNLPAGTLQEQLDYANANLFESW